MDAMRIARPALLGVVLALALGACGDAREDRAARDTNRSIAVNSYGTPTDRATAASAAARDGQRSDRAAVPEGTVAGDAALTAKVKSALMAEPGVGAMQIDVDTQGKRVTLSGEVDSPEHRQRALQAARGVEGVEGVIDRLAVKRG